MPYVCGILTERLFNKMFNKNKIYSSLAGLVIFLVLTISITSALAHKELKVEMSASVGEQTSQFPTIEQPLSLKLAVALGGLGLIGAELWWFIFSSKSR